jgi:hypothetical protein
VLRLAFIIFAAFVVVLLGLSLLPERAREIPDSAIRLQSTTLTLYPQSDPEAVWRFASPDVLYQPESRETTLRNLNNGERIKNGELDFTVSAEALTIGADDNIRSNALEVHLIEADWFMTMEARAERQVLIDQGGATFEIPRVAIRGEGIDGVYENMFISFDLTNFTSGGEGTVGYSTFDLDGN